MANSISENELRIQAAISLAEECNCDIEYSDSYTLQLDIDSPEALSYYHLNKYLLDMVVTANYNSVTKTEERLSRNGNTHIIIRFENPISIHERILLQACLGSDRKRELLSYIRHLNGIEQPILLFKPKSSQKGGD
jgi:hypothetical protein